MDCINAHVLTRLALDAKGNVQNRNVGITLDVHEAERHREKGVENDFETFQIASNWQEQVAQTDLVVAMRDFCAMVREWQERALIEG